MHSFLISLSKDQPVISKQMFKSTNNIYNNSNKNLKMHTYFKLNSKDYYTSVCKPIKNFLLRKSKKGIIIQYIFIVLKDCSVNFIK